MVVWPELVTVGLCIHEARVAHLCMATGLVELVVESGMRAGCGVVRAWVQGCMVVHGPRIGSEGKAGCAWRQSWLCMGTGLGCGGKAGCAWGQG